MKLSKTILSAAIIVQLATASGSLAQTVAGKSRQARGRQRAAAALKRKNNKMNTLTATQWGGQGIRMEKSDDGSYRLEFDCAHASIKQILLDAAGHFTAAGTFTPEHGGPIRSDEPDATRPATFQGKVSGNAMTLNIMTDNGKEPLGPYSLAANVSGRIFKCL